MLRLVFRPAGMGRAVRWERDERALWRAAPGFVVLLGPNDEAPLSLRGTGTALWATLDTPHTIQELVTDLAHEFGTTPDVVRRDIEPVLARLARAGAVRRLL